jgi:hypothetical protein
MNSEINSKKKEETKKSEEENKPDEKPEVVQNQNKQKKCNFGSKCYNKETTCKFEH